MRKRHGRFTVVAKKTLRSGMIAGIPLAVAGIAYALFFSNAFTINSIEVHAPKALNSESLRSTLYNQLDHTIFGIFQQKNIFLFDTSEAIRSISGMLLIKKLSIQKKFPRTIRVDVDGKEFQLLWYSRGSAWRVGGNGRIVENADQSTFASLPIQLLQKKFGSNVLLQDPHVRKNSTHPPLVADTLQEEVSVGSSVVEQSAIEQLMSLQDRSHGAGFETAYSIYHRQDSSVILVTTEGWEARIMLDSDLNNQFKALSVLLTQSIKKDRTRLKYIDVRFDNRGYYALN